MANNQIQMTEPTPLVWVSLVTPRPARPDGQSRYEVTFLLKRDHADLARIEAEIQKLALEKLGRTQGISIPLAGGDRLADEAKAKGKDREFLRGYIRLSAHAGIARRNGEPLMPPRIKVVLNGRIVDRTDDRALAQPALYSGVMAIGTVSFAAYDGMGGGISCYVNEVLSLNKGERINTGVSDEERYAEVIGKHIGHASTIDPTAGMGSMPDGPAGPREY
ncbi:MAG: ssDNA-binding protein [Methylocella sp.]